MACEQDMLTSPSAKCLWSVPPNTRIPGNQHQALRLATMVFRLHTVVPRSCAFASAPSVYLSWRELPHTGKLRQHAICIGPEQYMVHQCRTCESAWDSEEASSRLIFRWQSVTSIIYEITDPC